MEIDNYLEGVDPDKQKLIDYETLHKMKYLDMVVTGKLIGSYNHYLKTYFFLTFFVSHFQLYPYKIIDVRKKFN